MADHATNSAADTAAAYGFTSVNTPLHPAAPAPAPAPAPAASPAPAPTSTKRKRDAALKFYAVRVGKEPGVYSTWAECLEQVRGFPKAMFKSFTSLSDAENFVDPNTDALGNSGMDGPAAGKVTKWYGVRSGRAPGVYTSWAQVLDQITGWKAPKHKAFKTRIEAELYVKEGQQNHNGADEGMMDGMEEGYGATPASKKAKTVKEEPGFSATETGEYEPGEAPLPPDAEDGFDPTITIDPTTNALRYKTGAERTQHKPHPARPAPEAPIRIYTDGSSLANGRAEAIGGVGVYFGPADPRNISEPLTGTRQTNQRAELTAIARALEVAPKDRKVIIFSDSNYAINCTNLWFQNWRKNGWVSSTRKPVENRDLIQKIIDTLEARYSVNKYRQSANEVEDERVDSDDSAKPGPWERGPAGVKFVWVKGHAKDEGNNAADSLATAAAREAKELVEGVPGDEFA